MEYSRKLKNQLTKLLTIFFVFNLSIPVFAVDYVHPCGEAVGIKMYTEGLLVVGMSDVTDVNGKKIPAAKDSGLKIGDILLSANGQELEKTEDLSAVTESCTDKISLSIKRSDCTKEITVYPVMTESGPKIGLWVRDSTAGIGTVTYLSSDKKSYAALGHGITDVDTGNILSLKSGNILNCSLTSVKKSQKGNIGELNCSFDGADIGSLSLNAGNGIYGNIGSQMLTVGDEMRVASIDEICEDKAQILCSIDSSGVRYFDIEIKTVSKMNTEDKSLVIEITDPELIAQTGGIVQGMSGSPIIQNGLFVGAVTHVFINDPLKGFGVTGESMLANTKALE